MTISINLQTSSGLTSSKSRIVMQFESILKPHCTISIESANSARWKVSLLNNCGNLICIVQCDHVNCANEQMVYGESKRARESEQEDHTV